MWKLRIGTFVTSGVVVLAMSAGAWGASGSDANAGDVWVDNVGQPAGPGHEMDPHLACQDINLWGSGLADTAGAFAIDGWEPSGSQEPDYSGTWSYDQSPGRKSGSQVIATISVSKLINQAEANGDTPAAQGFHFKLDFSQDPQKHKTFWLDCPASSGGSSGGGGSDGGGGDPNHGGGTDTGGSTPPVTTTTTTTTTGTPIKTAVGSITVKRAKHHKTRKRHRKLVHPRRHRKTHNRRVRAVKHVVPSFTG